MNNVNMEKEQINVAEILRNCQSGMELDCTMYNKVTLLNVDDGKNRIFPIKVLREDGKIMTLTKYGQYTNEDFAKCVIFPKGKTNWEVFVPPCKFQDGDIVAHDNEFGKVELLIYKESISDIVAVCYLFLNDRTELHIVETAYVINRLATEEEKAKLFQAIKNNGYRWNSETKSLEKLVTPKFKVGDRIKHKDSGSILMIDDIDMSDSTYCCGLDHVWVADQDEYELVCPKFNISALKPFEKVLVRNSDDNMWCASMFSHTWKGTYLCAGMLHTQCIPYEGNEHMLGTTNSCEEFYKVWK